MSLNQRKFDICVLGATPAGVAAAVSAARLNKKVILVSYSDRIGGMQGWGINQTDVNVSATPSLVVGFAREFLSKVAKDETNAYKTLQRFVRVSATGRPSWFIRAFETIVAKEPNIEILYDQELVNIKKESVGSSSKIVELAVRDDLGTTTNIVAGQYVDATYTGDLIALAGCSFSIGRESNSLYGETLNGIMSAGTWAGSVTLSPYVVSGQPSSGFLPGYEDCSPAGTVGDGDGRLMGFGFRILVTTAADRIPFPETDLGNYRPENYELLARAMSGASASYDTLAEIGQLYALNTGSMSDLNNRGSCPFSTNIVGTECKDYVLGSKAYRKKIESKVKSRILGLFKWIKDSTDSRIPAGLKTNLATYGLVPDELQKYGGFSPELYVREARRLIGDLVVKESDISLTNGFTDPIAFGHYDIDSHTVRYVLNGTNIVPEGSILTALSGTQIGFPIPLRSIFPKRQECLNLSAPNCPSVSRVVWCSIRMEPILMAMGQAAGIAAAMAHSGNSVVHDVPYNRLARVQDIYGVWDGIVLGNDGTSFTEGTLTESGTWADNSTRFGFIGTKQRLAAAGANTARFAPNIQETGLYQAFVRYAPADTARATNASFVVSHADGTTTLTMNQLYPGGKGGDWESLGAYTFRAGTPSADYVQLSASGADSNVVVSAVKFVKM